VRLALAFPILASTIATEALAVPEDLGPLDVEIHDAGEIFADQVFIPLKVYYPSNGGPAPLVEVVHGAGRTGDNHVVLARTLASRGMVVLLPDIPCGFSGCDHQANARQVRAILDWAIAENAGPGALAGRVDTSKVALLGHSFGGLAVFLGARMPGLSALVLYDPKDYGRVARDDADQLQVPSAHLMATVRGACNDDWGTAVYPLTTAPHLRARVVNAGHCDVEDPGDNLCPFGCGAGDIRTSRTFRRYAVSFLGCVLKGDGAYAPYVGGDALDQDVTNGVLDEVDESGLDGLPCQGAPILDAGFPTPDTGVLPSADAGVGSPSDEADGCSCTLVGQASPWALFFGLVGLLVQRQHQARLAALRTVALHQRHRFVRR
jgi:dienelactone hydrolase